MKRKLPKNSLREKLDSTSYEFEEAHWENLATMLHEEGGLSGEETGINKSKLFWGGGALFLSAVLVGMFYFLPTKNTTLLVDTPQQKNTEIQKDKTLIPSEEKVKNLSDQSKRIEKVEQNVTENENEKKTIENVESNSRPTFKKQELPKVINKTKSRSTKESKSSPIALSNSSWSNEKERRENGLEKKNAVVLSSGSVSDKKTLDTKSSKTLPVFSEIPKASPEKMGAIKFLERSIAPLVEQQKEEDLIIKPNPLKSFKPARKKLRFGLLTGFNFSDGKPGLIFGWVLERRLKPKWYLELDMVHRRSRIDNWEIDLANLIDYDETYFAKSIKLLEYRDFPLLVKWRPQHKYSFYAGPRFAVISQALGEVYSKRSLPNDPINPPEQRVEPGSISLSTIRGIRRVEWGAVIGTTLHLDKNIGLGLRGNLGITSFVDESVIGPSPKRGNLELQFLVQLHF